MKRIFAILLVFVIAFSFVACEKANNTSSEVEIGANTQTESTDTTSTETEQSEDAETSATESTNSTVSSENQSTTGTPNESENSQTNEPDESSKPEGQTHTHSFASATCTEAKKCSCGATEGVALGHKWIDATCTTPKTCSVCKTTEGEALGHKYIGYECELCDSLDVSKNYIKVTGLGVDGKGMYERAGEDFAFDIQDGCENYVTEIKKISANINGQECKVHQALMKTNVEKLADNYVTYKVNELYNKGRYEEGEEEFYRELANEYYLPHTAVIGVDYPVGIFEKLTPVPENPDFYSCDFSITAEYILSDGAIKTQTWNIGVICCAYGLGTIPVECFNF